MRRPIRADCGALFAAKTIPISSPFCPLFVSSLPPTRVTLNKKLREQIGQNRSDLCRYTITHKGLMALIRIGKNTNRRFDFEVFFRSLNQSSDYSGIGFAFSFVQGLIFRFLVSEPFVLSFITLINLSLTKCFYSFILLYLIKNEKHIFSNIYKLDIYFEVKLQNNI